MVILSIDIIKANGNNPRGISRHLSSKCSVWTSVSQSASVTKIILFLTSYLLLIDRNIHLCSQLNSTNQSKPRKNLFVKFIITDLQLWIELGLPCNFFGTAKLQFVYFCSTGRPLSKSIESSFELGAVAGWVFPIFFQASFLA